MGASNPQTGLSPMKSFHHFFNIPCDSIRARFAAGIGWNTVSAASTQGSVFLANVIIANLLGREVFGEFGMIQNTVLLFAGMGQLATGIAATKYVAEFRSSNPEKVGRILGLCSFITFLAAGIATLITILTAPIIASFLLKAPHLTIGLILSAGIIFFSILTGFQTGALAGLEAYGRLGRASISQGVLYLGVCSFFSFFWRLEGALGGMAIGFGLRWYIFNRAFLQECARQNISMNYRHGWSERSIINKFGIPSAAIGFFSIPAVWLTNVFLVRQSDGYSQMGIFSAAYSLRTMIIFLPQLMNNVGMSLLNYQKGAQNLGKYRKVFFINFFLTQLLGLVGGFLVLISGPWLLRVFGKEFSEGYPVLKILVLSALAETLSMALYQIIQSQEKMWLSFFSINIPWWFAFLISAYILIPGNLAKGLAWAYLAAWGIHATMTGFQVWRIGFGRQGNQ
jgi:O-antigen/teichoic acid export membrane protein